MPEKYPWQLGASLFLLLIVLTLLGGELLKKNAYDSALDNGANWPNSSNIGLGETGKPAVISEQKEVPSDGLYIRQYPRKYKLTPGCTHFILLTESARTLHSATFVQAEIEVTMPIEATEKVVICSNEAETVDLILWTEN